jgi:hypothetical protein
LSWLSARRIASAWRVTSSVIVSPLTPTYGTSARAMSPRSWSYAAASRRSMKT